MSGPDQRRGPFTTVSRGAARAFVALSALTLGMALTGFLWTAAAVRNAEHHARALCRFDADLAGVPVAVNPKTGRPALLGVAIVSDARVAWHQAGCTGLLPPPDPSFTRWANFYRLPIG